MRYRNLIGPQVRRLRNQRGWTQDRLAKALQRAGLDVSRSRLAKIEGRVVWVADYELYYFLKVFQVGFEDLFPPVDPQDPELYDTLTRLMKSRF